MKIKPLTFLLALTLFLVGCNARYVLNVSYDPIDSAPPFLSPKDKQPVLYINSVKDNRNFALEHKDGIVSWWSGRFEEDPLLIQKFRGLDQSSWRTSKALPEIIREALETEVHRFRIKITKNRDSADGVINASIEEFRATDFEMPTHLDKFPVKINLELYQQNIDDPVWSGILKGKQERTLNLSLSMAIKQWHDYPGFKEALVSLKEVKLKE
jgi:hypothetical protein